MSRPCPLFQVVEDGHIRIQAIFRHYRPDETGFLTREICIVGITVYVNAKRDAQSPALRNISRKLLVLVSNSIAQTQYCSVNATSLDGRPVNISIMHRDIDYPNRFIQEDCTVSHVELLDSCARGAPIWRRSTRFNLKISMRRHAVWVRHVRKMRLCELHILIVCGIIGERFQ